MNHPQLENEVSDLPLPDTQRELEQLLEALNALNQTLDRYEAEETVGA
jgi:ribosome assembly protein YihI (activator of Der GTPase)